MFLELKMEGPPTDCRNSRCCKLVTTFFFKNGIYWSFIPAVWVSIGQILAHFILEFTLCTTVGRSPGACRDPLTETRVVFTFHGTAYLFLSMASNSRRMSSSSNRSLTTLPPEIHAKIILTAAEFQNQSILQTTNLPQNGNARGSVSKHLQIIHHMLNC